MGRLFVSIYQYFATRHKLLYPLLIGSFALMLFFGLQVRFTEDVTSFFPDGKDNAKTLSVFKNLKVKDKIFVLISPSDTLAPSDPDALIEAGDRFVARLLECHDTLLIRSIHSQVDERQLAAAGDFIYDHLPILLDDAAFETIDSLLSEETLDRRMEQNYNSLTSPLGIGLKEFIFRDPAGLGYGLLAGLQDFGKTVTYQIVDGHIFSPDLSTMLIIIDPRYGMGSTGNNDQLVDDIETAIASTQQATAQIHIEYFGGPCVGVYNARQIKQDTMITLSVAILIILLVLSFAFRTRWAMVLIALPVAYGGAFALAVIYLIQGSMSAISIGAGAAVFGIAMSYSIHVLAHRNHIQTISQLIEELAYPLTIGSFTTIGAFLGLMFTSSGILRDFGLFSALTLIGTTVFTLLFLPHFLPKEQPKTANRLLKIIERVNRYAYHRNKWLVGGIVLLAGVCLFTYNDVRFDSDMMHLSLEPSHLKRAEKHLSGSFDSNNNTVLIVSANREIDSAVASYHKTNAVLRELQRQGVVGEVVGADPYLITQQQQRRRIERWQRYWTPERIAQVEAQVAKSAAKQGLNAAAFAPFSSILRKTYTPTAYSETTTQDPLFENFISSTEELSMLITNIKIAEKDKGAVYKRLAAEDDVVVLDRHYFSNQMAVSVNNDFYLILYISSLLIFLALVVSYGRIELAAMAFVPMALSWLIILGLMALFGIEFNIVNIILSTFIFGIGDDFSIFIMDGLLCEYRTGRKMLTAHKTAIFFSAFTTIVGIGALAFAEHPALKSISTISILGIVSVVLISYTVQPILFRLFVSSQTAKGGFPYTLASLLNTLYAFLYFLVGCLAIQLLMLVLFVVPLARERRKGLVHRAVSWSTRFFLRTMITVKRVCVNPTGEHFEKPAVIVANHQSFIDILVLLSLHPKMVMVTNGWVWNSPFFGRIVRYCDFFHTGEGLEAITAQLQERVAEGYSVIIFPEGTRSADCTIRRFHKGAFYLADKLRLDILPIVLFGNGLASSKRQPFYIKKGLLVSNILPRISCDDPQMGRTYKEQSKCYEKLFREQYAALCRRYATSENPYFYDALIKSYTYKGPVLEWYMRVKVKLEGSYKRFDELIPRAARVVDIGCGYGPLSFMLSMLSSEREVLGIDYDREKIEVANHSFLRKERLRFECADAMEYALPQADVFIMNDVLHYLSCEDQRRLIGRCIAKLNRGGRIIIRDGDSSKTERQRITKLTEILSTQVVGFNKTQGALCFTSSQSIVDLAQQHNMSVQQLDNDTTTSNTIYILRRNE